MTFQMKGGHTATDPRLGRVPTVDERNKDFPLGAVIDPSTDLVKKTWTLRHPRLDQGQDGTCVGHGWTHWYNAAPRIHRDTHEDALRIYHRAQQLDEYPGENYEGTSVLGGAKAAKEAGWVDTYRWAANVDEILQALSHVGPVVMGSSWLQNMFEPVKGYLDVSGGNAGGHCWLLRAIDPSRDRVRMANSWGDGWGLKGDAWIHVKDLRSLWDLGAEACVATELAPPKGRWAF